MYLIKYKGDVKMKIFKTLTALLASTVLVSGLFVQPAMATTSNASQAKEAKVPGKPVKPIKVGMTVQDLSNPIFAGACQELQKLVQNDGGELTYVACQSNLQTQIQQLEDFISKKVDIIVVHSADPNGVEPTLEAAKKAGIKVFSWDDNLQNADIAWLINNKDLGYLIGTEAAKFINEKLGGNAEVAVLDYPQLPILLERGNGILEALKEKAPNAKVVAQQSAINVAEGQTKMETIFQANPNVKVVACIGGGGAVGANEAAKAGNKIADDFGIFAADATDPELAAIKSGEGNRMSVLITGDAKAIANEIYYYLVKLQNGEKVEKEQYRELIPVTKENIDEHLK